MPRRGYTPTRVYLTRSRTSRLELANQAAQEATPVDDSDVPEVPEEPPLSPIPSLGEPGRTNEVPNLSDDDEPSRPIITQPLKPPKHQEPTRNMAVPQLVWDIPTKAPLLTAGDPTPAILQEWLSAVHGYQAAKDVAEDKIVSVAMAGLQDPRLRQWCEYERLTLVALTLDEFY